MTIRLPDTTGAPLEPVTPGTYGVTPPGYRLPPRTRVGAVRLLVSDLARSLQWYNRLLGFRVLAATDTKATLGTDGEARPLIELNQQAGARPSPRRGRLGLFHFAVLLPEKAALGRFLASLVQQGAPVGASDHLVSEALYLYDPDGLGVEVYADRPTAEWQRRGPELAMATEPLDTRAVMRAGGTTSWAGMPPGTTIGHVHLHVGDLERAADFYHAGMGLDAMVWSYPGALFLAAGGYHHHLAVNTWAGPGASPPGPEDARLLEWELLVPSKPDAVASAAAMLEAGIAVRQDAEGWSASDPWGTAMRVSALSEESGPSPEVNR